MHIQVLHTAHARINDKIIVFYPRGIVAEVEDSVAKQMIKDRLARKITSFLKRDRLFVYEDIDCGESV